MTKGSKATKNRRQSILNEGSRMKAPVAAGLSVGVGFIAVFSAILYYSDPVPPEMIIIVDGKQYRAGIGSYGGSLPFGRGYVADVDSSRTLPKDTIIAQRGSEIHFSSDALFTSAAYAEGWTWMVDRKSDNQYFLDKVGDSTFKVPSDVPDGDYVLSTRATWDGHGPVSVAHYVHKIRIS